MSTSKRNFRKRKSPRESADVRDTSRDTKKKLPLLFRWYAFFESRPLLGYAVLTVLLMLAVYSLEGLSGYFKASILESQVPTLDIHGTTMPIKKVPNWVQVGGQNTRDYSEYSANELIPLMPYAPQQLLSDAEDEATINAKITYSVVYMGNYQFEHKEYAGSHPAVDIRVPMGTPIYAVADGVVVKAVEQSTGFGNHIVLKIPKVPLEGRTEPIYAAYAHLSRVLVTEGQIVKKGEKIGETGESGTATTPHLHFQIDLDAAPWHPYWLFSSVEANAAGLSFFDAINVGLGKEKANQYLLNPLEWVQGHLDEHTVVADTGGDTNGGLASDQNTTAIFEDFEIEVSPSEVASGETVTFKITAYDDKKNILDNFSEDFSFTCSDTEIKLPEIQFVHGVATVAITTMNEGRVKCSIENQDDIESVRVTVSAPADDQEQFHAAGDETSDFRELDHLEITAEDLVLGLGTMTPITVRALDRDNQLLEDFLPSTAMAVTATNGTPSLQTLRSEDFSEGTAHFTFIAEEAGTAEIRIEDFGRLEIQVNAEIESVVRFEMETERQFIKDIPQEIIITTVDRNDKVTARKFLGTARLSFLVGGGNIEPQKLTADDFQNGQVTVRFTVHEGNRAKLKIQSGVLVGQTGDLREDDRKIFADVSTDDKYAEAISYLKEQNVFTGYPDGTFQVNRELNRAELTKVVLEALKIKILSGQANFADVLRTDWFSEYVFTAVDNAIVNGYPDSTFKPARPINRAEFFKILLEADKAAMSSEIDDDPFADVERGEWYSKYAKYAKENGLLDFGERFHPEEEVTRGEVAEALYRLLR